MNDQTVADLAKLASDAWRDAHATEAGMMASRQADMITAGALAAGMPPALFAVMAMSLVARAAVLQSDARETTVAEEWDRMKASMNEGFAAMGKTDE